MIDSIIQWSLRNRVVVLAAAAAVLIGGAVVATRMPVDVFPDLTAPTVTVIAEAHGMAPQEVETQIVVPIESALNGATGVRRVRSSSPAACSRLRQGTMASSRVHARCGRSRDRIRRHDARR